MTNIETVSRDSRSYRQGLVLGLTMAEVFLLLVFALLIALAALWNSERQKRRIADESKAQPGEMTAADRQLFDNVKAAIAASSSDRVSRAIQQLKDGHELQPLTSAENEFISEVRTAKARAKSKPISDDWRALTRAAGTIDNLDESLTIAETVKEIVSDRRDRPRLISIIRLGLAAEKKGEHDWPPIITLSDAKDFSFEKGLAQLTTTFESRLRTTIVPQLLELAKRYGVSIIEVVGHTDEQKIAPRNSNLDALLINVLRSSEPLSTLIPADNAGLGLARATAVVRVLRSDERLKDYTLLPLSGGQLIGTDDMLTTGGGGDERERRRIEIRVRRPNVVNSTASISKPAASTPLASGVAAGSIVEGRVNWIVDGDTFDMQVNTQTVRIRICGINAPEKGEQGYDKARDFLHSGIMNRTLRCVPTGAGSVCDGRSAKTNQGRLVAQCFLENDFDIAVPIVETGNACDWPYFSGGHYQRAVKGKACVDKRVY